MPKTSPKGRSPQFNMIVPDGFLESIENWRAKQRPIPTRTAAIIELCQRAIRADEASKLIENRLSETASK